MIPQAPKRYSRVVHKNRTMSIVYNVIIAENCIPQYNDALLNITVFLHNIMNTTGTIKQKIEFKIITAYYLKRYICKYI